MREAVLDADVDVAISASMDVDHGTVQPLQTLFGDAAAVPVIPIFINSVATPLGPLKRARALGAAVGDFLPRGVVYTVSCALDKKVVVIGLVVGLSVSETTSCDFTGQRRRCSLRRQPTLLQSLRDVGSGPLHQEHA